MADLGTAAGVQRIIGKTSDDLTDAEAESFLDEAVRKIRGKTYTQWMLDRFYANTVPANGSTNRVFCTYWAMKDDTSVLVYQNGAILTVTTDYTVDETKSAITITSDVQLSDGDTVHIYYKPEWYDDWANYMAAKRIVDTSLVDIPSSAQGTSIFNNIRFTLQEYETMLLSKPQQAKFRDHRELGSIW